MNISDKTHVGSILKRDKRISILVGNVFLFISKAEAELTPMTRERATEYAEQLLGLVGDLATTLWSGPAEMQLDVMSFLRDVEAREAAAANKES